ncbi:hypothetical protein RZ532_12815, partial [Nitratireductor aquimarinus]|uniref:hypothetical protein n=1 Tax=Nitratireductor aquimarinus TaxID=889300 RepID=UPI002935A8BA
GAAIGNALGNELRKQDFIERCMVLHGWRSVSTSSAQGARKKKAQERGLAEPGVRASGRSDRLRLGKPNSGRGAVQPPAGPVTVNNI